MVVSKRVTNAKSERHYKGALSGRKASVGFWQNLRSSLKTHPLLLGFVAFIMIFSGVASFFMYAPAMRAQLGSPQFNDA